MNSVYTEDLRIVIGRAVIAGSHMGFVVPELGDVQFCGPELIVDVGDEAGGCWAVIVLVVIGMIGLMTAEVEGDDGDVLSEWKVEAMRLRRTTKTIIIPGPGFEPGLSLHSLSYEVDSVQAVRINTSCTVLGRVRYRYASLVS